ncbi:MAG: mercury methylation corrinoid protein HgcA [Deltaproteobacteria bacterium]
MNVSAEWKWTDHVGRILCRISGFRMRYSVQPGLYAVGSPGSGSDVFVSANYKLSFDILRAALKGLDAWVLVLDTKGINVWCAAGKGTFGTDELIRRISEAALERVVSHTRVIVPQLGAPGVSASAVQRATGFRVHYGPVEARDIREYLAAGRNATQRMRRVRFGLFDRLVLIPMELFPAIKIYPLYSLLILVVMALGLPLQAASLRGAATEAVPLLVMGIAAIAAGAIAVPLLLPVLPFRSFALKGWLAGIVAAFFTATGMGIGYSNDALLFIMAMLFFPAASSYIALQFTGATTFTGPSGVRKELRYAMPVYAVAGVISLALLVVFKLERLGIL